MSVITKEHIIIQIQNLAEELTPIAELHDVSYSWWLMTEHRTPIAARTTARVCFANGLTYSQVLGRVAMILSKAFAPERSMVELEGDLQEVKTIRDSLDNFLVSLGKAQ